MKSRALKIFLLLIAIYLSIGLIILIIFARPSREWFTRGEFFDHKMPLTAQMLLLWPLYLIFIFVFKRAGY